MALTICKAFAEKLPNKPTAMHALGEALHAVYGKAPDILAGTYAVSAHETADIQTDTHPAARGQYRGSKVPAGDRSDNREPPPHL